MEHATGHRGMKDFAQTVTVTGWRAGLMNPLEKRGMNIEKVNPNSHLHITLDARDHSVCPPLHRTHSGQNRNNCPNK